MTLIRHAREGTPRKNQNLLNEPRVLKMVVGKRMKTAVERALTSTAKVKQREKGRIAEEEVGCECTRWVCMKRVAEKRIVRRVRVFISNWAFGPYFIWP